jgi:hypothetical protein
LNAAEGAVGIVLAGREVWISPAEANEFARDIARMSFYAAGGRGPRAEG